MIILSTRFIQSPLHLVLVLEKEKSYYIVEAILFNVYCRYYTVKISLMRIIRLI